MFVETTRQRLDWFARLLEREHGLGELTASWFEAAVPARSNRVIAPLPPDGWLLLSELAMDEVYGVRGFGRPKVKRYQVLATQEVVTAVNARRRHPAFARRKVAGLQTTHLPAWLDWSVDLRVPFSRELVRGAGDHFVILTPWFEGGYTEWRELLPGAGPDLGAPKGYARLFEEAEHLRFAVERKTHR